MNRILPVTYLGSQALFHSEVEKLGETPLAEKLKLPELLLNWGAEIPFIFHPLDPLFENLRGLIHEIEEETSKNLETKPSLERIRNYYQTYIYTACFPKLSVDPYLSLFDTAENSKEIEKYALKTLPTLNDLYRDPTHPELIRCLNKLGQVALAEKKPEKALLVVPDALSYNLLRANNTRLLEEIASSCTLLASAHLQIHQPHLAFEEADLLLLYRRSLYRMPSPPLGRTVKDLATAYNSEENQNKVLEHLLMANEEIQSVYGLNPSPMLAVSLYKTGNIFSKKGQNETARQYISKALELFQISRSEELQPNVAITLKEMGLFYQNLLELPLALKCFEKALNILQTQFPDQPHAKPPSLLKEIGLLYKELNQNDSADKYLTEAYEEEKKLHKSPFHPKIASALRTLGLFQFEQKAYQKAFTSLISARDLLTNFDQSQEHPDFAITHLALAVFFNRVGALTGNVQNYAHAASFFQRAIESSQEALEHAEKQNQGDVYQMSKKTLEEASNHLSHLQQLSKNPISEPEQDKP